MQKHRTRDYMRHHSYDPAHYETQKIWLNHSASPRKKMRKK